MDLPDFTSSARERSWGRSVAVIGNEDKLLLEWLPWLFLRRGLFSRHVPTVIFIVFVTRDECTSDWCCCRSSVLSFGMGLVLDMNSSFVKWNQRNWLTLCCVSGSKDGNFRDSVTVCLWIMQAWLHFLFITHGGISTDTLNCSFCWHIFTI